MPAVKSAPTRIPDLVERLRTASRLSEPDGIVALRRLAKLYFDMGRYAEAAATMREAWIKRHACSRADCPGRPEFSDEHRAAAEAGWFKANEFEAKEIAHVRNDIEHGGYNSNSMPPETIKRKILELIERLAVEEKRENV